MGSLGRTVLAVSGALAFAASGAAAAQASPVVCPETASGEMVTASQAKLVTKSRLPVRVTMPEPCFRAKVKVRVFDRAPGKQARRIGKPKERFLAPGKQRVMRPRLTARGAKRLKRCTPRTLIVKVRHADSSGRYQFAKRRRAPLVVDLPRCTAGPGPDPNSLRAYALDPPGDATHTNDTPRELTATGVGGDEVRVEPFACDSFTESGGELSFESQDGVAQPGSPAGSTSESVAAGNGDLRFEVTGSDGCVAPVVYRDANGNGGLDVGPDGVPAERYGGGGTTTFEPQGVAFQDADRCDPLDPAVCLQPFPNDHFTVADTSTDTGRRISFATESMPASNVGVNIEATEWNRNDGYSPGSMLITRVPGLDSPEAFEQTDPVPITDIERSFEPDAPIVVIDAESGERHLIWSELDANPENPADVNLIIRPAVNFEEGHRYIVALRDLRGADGAVIEPGRAFELYRDRVITSDPAVEERRGEIEEIFATLGDAGIARDDLHLAWDFTVGSERSLSERALHIRDDAFAQLGDTNLADLEVQGVTPTIQVTGVTNYEPCDSDGNPECSDGSPVFEQDPLPVGPGDLPLVGGVYGPTEDQLSTVLGDAPEDDRIVRKVEGQVVVPCYTDGPGCQTGTQFAYSGPRDTIPDRLPGNATLANFTCVIPRSAVGADGGIEPVRPSLYGHGLLGGAGEVEAGNVVTMADDHGFMFCATDWAGFATQDLPTIALILQDLNNFPKLVDRSQQGFLNFMFLGRAMIHPQGFSSSPAFRIDGQPVIDTQRLFYDGNSQGGILGGSLAALAPDLDRAVLGVPGMNYSTLLRRSVDFAPYAEGEFVDGIDLPVGLYDRYPNELERPLVLALMQMLWDRGEMNGYAHHLSGDPLANTPDHEVLMQVAFGDHQVSIWTAEVAARTMGAATNPIPLDPGRHPDTVPLFDIPRISDFAQTPYDGSALIYFDSGTPAPPITNTPPEGEQFGDDPHGRPRSDPAGQLQKSEFLRVGGRVVDVCGGGPCYAGGYTGPPSP